MGIGSWTTRERLLSEGAPKYPRPRETDREVFYRRMLEVSPKWTHRPELPCHPATEAGKLEPPCTRDRVQGGKRNKVQPLIISPVISADSYRVVGEVDGISTSFLLDTGAAVTLLREDVWRKTKPRREKNLRPWSVRHLVGVDGSPLEVRGCVEVELIVANEKFKMDVVIVGSLTSEAILGLDFLRRFEAIIDLKEKQLILPERGCRLPLTENLPLTEKDRLDVNPTVSLVDSVSIPPCSEEEVMAATQEPIGEGPWLMQAIQQDRLQAVVASALVDPRTGQVPVRLLNPRAEPVKIRKGTQIATIQRVHLPVTDDVVVAAADLDQASPDMRQALWGVAESLGPDRSEGEKEQFYHLLLLYADVFASSDSDVGRTGKLQHEISTGESPPIRQAVRRIPPLRRKEVRDLLATMLRNDVVQPSNSPWASPIVLVQKKDGSTRFCIDYRKLNNITRKDAYPLPRIDDTLSTLAGSECFTTLDLVSGFWQVEVAEKDRAKTAFCMTEGLFEFKVMPFGLCNAPATFQRLMDLVLAGLQWEHCLVYLDDVIVFGRNFPEHLKNLQMVFERLRQAGLKLKPSKCAFFQREVRYLGHVVSKEGIATDPTEWETATAC